MSICSGRICSFVSGLFGGAPKSLDLRESMADMVIELNETREIESFLNRLRLSQSNPREFAAELLSGEAEVCLRRLIELDRNLDEGLASALAGLDSSTIERQLRLTLDESKRRALRDAISWLQFRARLFGRTPPPERPPFTQALAELGGLLDLLSTAAGFVESAAGAPEARREATAEGRGEGFEGLFVEAFHLQLVLAANADRLGDPKVAVQLGSRLNNLLSISSRFKEAMKPFKIGKSFIVKFEQYNDKNTRELVQKVKDYAYAELSSDRPTASAALASIPKILRNILRYNGTESSSVYPQIDELERRLKGPKKEAPATNKNSEPSIESQPSQGKPGVFEKKPKLNDSDF